MLKIWLQSHLRDRGEVKTAERAIEQELVAPYVLGGQKLLLDDGVYTSPQGQRIISENEVTATATA